MPFVTFPKNMHQAAGTIREVCDQYWDRKITFDEASSVIKEISVNYEYFYEENGSYRKALADRVGQKRISLMNKILS